MSRVVIANRRDGGWWWRLPLVTAIWLTIAAPIIVALVVIHTLRSWASDLPRVPDLSAWLAEAHQTSYIVAADGSRLAELPFKDEADVVGHRMLLSMDDLPPQVVEAVLAAEDVRFFSHHGVDYRAITRAAWANYQAQRVVEGASTITQQVARNLLPQEIGKERSAKRKVREALLARAIEARWTKREILDVYLNFVFLGQNAYGIAAASRAYFAKPATELDLAEAALLAGLIQAPSRLDPFHHPEAAKTRRDEILARMARAHLIDEATRAKTAALPVVVRRPLPTYGTRVGWYTEAVRQLVADAFPTDMDQGGIVIETAALPALGTQLQQDAGAHAEKWAQGKQLPQLGALLWDHRTGYVEALIGGRDPWTKRDKFDRMLQSCRQPGSAWKPLVYGSALESGAITPGTALRDAPIAEYDEVTNTHWKPKSGNRFRGVVLAQDAFASSLNSPAIDVFDRVGAQGVIKFARRLGITSDLAEVRPMALGASCVKPIELARVFAIVARRGWAIAPRLAIRVRRGDDILFDASVPEDPWLSSSDRIDRVAAIAGEDPAERILADGEQLISEPVAFQLGDMMHAVVERGTAAAANVGRPAAGKTGTTNENTDAWFIGFTGRELGAVWIGFDDPATKLGTQGDGAHAALPLWTRAIRAAEGDRVKVDVPGAAPSDMLEVAIDRETGLLAAPGAPGETLWFRNGTQPQEVAGQVGTSPTDFGRTSREF
ncbi:MAG TPA: transglycosylase domain-containing protein [Kofleriaceae bacterium]|nr:transglycosylase domain-containing protein [Kofleriaceae bacterium]